MTAPHTPQPVALTRGQELLFPALPYAMGDRVSEATLNGQLQQFVHRATTLKDTARKAVWDATYGDRYDAMRDMAASIKQHTLDHLDHYLEQFIERAESAGVQVHFARDAKQANEIVVAIARREDCRLCVKAKSMVTEETHLVPALEAVGCETIETDLAEFILQIDNDAPSHIVTAMIHKDRTAVGRAFERVLGVPYTDDPQTLTKIARAHLRDKYRRADLGVSGGNFLVADTGSLVMCTNEGNGRMCTTVPRIHVAMVGIEKLIPSLEHLGVMLKVLVRSSTAQPLTVYTHVMTGPQKSDEHAGPQQMHIVLLDNGRTDVLREETREMLRCIRCGACLNACPVYRKIGGHAYGAVYSGPIGAILTPMLRGLENYPELPHASSLCGACYEACPVKIDIPKYLVKLRGMAHDRGISSWRERAIMRLWAWSLGRPWAYRMGQRMQKLLRLRATRSTATDPYADRGWVARAGGPLAGWTSQRDMPAPPSRTFRDWWERRDV
jgi:L-lactate dehydrogenase complex protein LldF